MIEYTREQEIRDGELYYEPESREEFDRSIEDIEQRVIDLQNRANR